MNTVLPKIEATGDESLLEVAPVASILGTHQPAADPAPLTPPPSSEVKTPAFSKENQPYASLSQTKVEGFLNNPRTMMGVKFMCAPPSTADEDLQGDWTLASHVVCIGDDDSVDEEYAVRLGAITDGPILMTMSRDEVQYLLSYSRLA